MNTEEKKTANLMPQNAYENKKKKQKSHTVDKTEQEARKRANRTRRKLN